MTHTGRNLSGVAVLLSVLVGCGSSGDTSSSSSSSGSSGSTAALRGLLPDSIKSSGTITFGTDFTTTPFEFYDSNHNPVGIDVDLCGQVAKHMGLTPKWSDLNFDGLIPALQSNRFDAICAGMFITPKRTAVIDFVPYITTGQSIMVQKGNPHNVKSLLDLCGLNVSLTVGAAEVQTVADANKACASAGKPAIQTQEFNDNGTTIQQVVNKRVDAFVGDDPPVAYFAAKAGSDVEVATSGIKPILNGIGVTKTNRNLTGAITVALYNMVEDGTYQAVLQKWNIKADAVGAF